MCTACGKATPSGQPRYRLGRRPFLYRLWPLDGRRHDHSVEGKPVGTPDAGTYWRVIRDHKVKALFTAPTAFRAIRREDPEAELLASYDLSSFRTLFLAGERADSETLKWAERHLNVPVIDHWWQTETGWPVACNPVGLELLPVKHGSPATVLPGYQLDALDDEGHLLPRGVLGNLF